VAVASAGQYASLHLAPDRLPCQHSTTQFFTGRMPCLPPNQHRQSSEGTVIDFSELKTHCVHWVSGLVLYRALQRKVKHVNNFLSCTFISADAWVKQRLNSHCSFALCSILFVTPFRKFSKHVHVGFLYYASTNDVVREKTKQS